MIYYTGDIHGEVKRVVDFCSKFELTTEDTLVLLGDVGINYYGDNRDNAAKKMLSSVAPTILCVHGNHEMRPEHLVAYRTQNWNSGTVWYEEQYPNILFAKDGEIFCIEGLSHLVIGGAYSVDKYYRMARGYNWWPDEQPSESIKSFVEQQIHNKQIDIVLSHTCPQKYVPVECFLPGIEQSTVDKSTEIWLDKIENAVDYRAWFCGHWHIDKHIDRIHFLFHAVETNAEI